ncbi:MAG: branched-chain amino acid ABC transporter permease [Chloroflexi bacterium]|nr:branched-chain amino acid ABC transporter permease [Chloroflexota bacterium]
MSAFAETILIAALLNAIVALGLYVTVMSGQLSVAHAGLMGVGAYTSAVLTVNFHWPFLAALVAGLIPAALLGAGIAGATLRMSELVGSLATLGFGETLSVAAFNITYIGGANSFQGIPLHTRLPITLVFFALTVYCVWRFEQSRLGLAARAIRANPIPPQQTASTSLGFASSASASAGASPGWREGCRPTTRSSSGRPIWAFSRRSASSSTSFSAGRTRCWDRSQARSS